MSHSTKLPSISKSTANLPTDVEDGTTAYDTDQSTLVVRVGGAWEKAGGAGATTPTVVYDDGTAVGNTDQIQGDIPNDWKKTDSSLTGLVIGTSCRNIGNYAFQTCSGLTGALIIPNSVLSIGGYAFFQCSNLTGTLTIPNSVNSINVYAFASCSSITNINCYVEKSVLDVSFSLWSSGVTTIHVRSTDTTWTAGAGQTIGDKAGIEVIKDL